jgi:Cu(I)/Ag(I) efflux system membrane fusion protein
MPNIYQTAKALLKPKEMNKLIYLALLLVVFFAACKHKPKPIVNQQNKAYYTCSMHPQVHEDHDGNCPICGMKLIKIELTNAASTNTITLNTTQMQLAGIQTDTIREENTGSEKTLTGTVTTNENTAAEFSARLAGRVQQLFVRAIGEKVTIGQPIYALYSEDLQEAEKEFLLAKQQQKVLHNPDVDYNQLISAAESKLKLWGLSTSQIKTLAATQKVSATTTILSNVAGTVSNISVHEGDYVTEGMTVLKTQGLNSLWVEAQLYASETGFYKENDMVNVSLPDLGGTSIKGKVEFINPELSDVSKVDLIRISIPNPQELIRPGMQAYIAISSGDSRSLAVPASAILTNGKGSMVYVKNTNGSFSPRMIKTGIGNQNYLSILSGLNAGDVVVTNGAYLLNSEAIFKNGSGNNTAGMKM